VAAVVVGMVLVGGVEAIDWIAPWATGGRSENPGLDLLLSVNIAAAAALATVSSSMAVVRRGGDPGMVDHTQCCFKY